MIGKSRIVNIAAAAAMAGLFAGTGVIVTGCHLGNDASTSSGDQSCKGRNACKGQGQCKTTDHGCKGQNSCRGQGGAPS